MNTLLILGLFLVAVFTCNTVIVWVAARLCRLPKRSWRRAAYIALIRLAFGFVVLAAWLTLFEGSPFVVVGSLAIAVADVALTVLLIRWLLGGRGGPVAGAWGIQFGLGAVAAIALVLVLHAFGGAYVVPTSSMSPSIRGYHTIEDLPDGNHLIVAANDPRDPRPLRAGTPSGGIVAETFEFREVPRPAKHTHPADRILCNKTKFPERWDVAFFKYPLDPTIRYVKRLVGLPGEHLEIHDGAVWINGEKLTPPERLGPIRYTASAQGDRDNPLFDITLGPDEFFVLGDNTQHCADSRMWGPVERDQILGVADVIYWPPSRWRLNP